MLSPFTTYTMLMGEQFLLSKAFSGGAKRFMLGERGVATHSG